MSCLLTSEFQELLNHFDLVILLVCLHLHCLSWRFKTSPLVYINLSSSPLLYTTPRQRRVMKTVFLMFSLVVSLEAGMFVCVLELVVKVEVFWPPGVPVNIPCLTGATVRGTTAPPCSGSGGGGGGGDCRTVGPGRCAVLYDKRGEE